MFITEMEHKKYSIMTKQLLTVHLMNLHYFQEQVLEMRLESAIYLMLPLKAGTEAREFINIFEQKF